MLTSELDEIAKEIKKCRKCKLWLTKQNYVPGEGNCKALIVFVGEAPGREEDIHGRPFVGNAGKLLTEMISRKLNLSRKDVFITNILKCRPPNNRDPLEEEIKACKPYLIRQLKSIRPKAVVCLGRHSASLIFSFFGLEFNGISKERGKIYEVEVEWGKMKVIAVYHPAAALYKPPLREVLEKDFEKIGSILKKRRTLEDFMEL
ncbi:uracil-DNA glycosylase, family 4 [Archaeoglobus sulfaticallidus PM70-1]|uniref:Type-4 uracil-DNA glycosylase n=1 Tax=Archaeoglobus sulfaticallidus PM70-1 TaxID=387631 RepID=N0BBN4_9EURY|nr:type-4 uracil-DNA glycosylase [Archaeoglobus sulfaticallidus]AGK60999.1 uracil-DNA glycosylase, family 4 [Archaeoglobus sulfaticallidus PM70-1]